MRRRGDPLQPNAIGMTYTEGANTVVEIIRKDLKAMAGFGRDLHIVEHQLSSVGILNRKDGNTPSVKGRWPGRKKQVRYLKLVFPKKFSLSEAIANIT